MFFVFLKYTTQNFGLAYKLLFKTKNGSKIPEIKVPDFKSTIMYFVAKNSATSNLTGMENLNFVKPVNQ